MVKRIEALARGLSVLEALAAGASSLTELRTRTGIDKATLLRVLKTLDEQGWVHRRLGDSRYHLRTELALRRLPEDPHERLIERGGPLLGRLSARTGLASDLAVRHGCHMRIIESTRRFTRLPLAQRIIGIEPHMLWSALGRAYLAYCPRQERRELVAELARSRDRRDATAGSSTWVERVVRETRARGYGVREPRYWRHSVSSGEPVSAIALPVTLHDGVIAAINMVWPESALDFGTVATRHLPLLRETAAALGEAMRDETPPRIASL